MHHRKIQKFFSVLPFVRQGPYLEISEAFRDTETEYILKYAMVRCAQIDLKCKKAAHSQKVVCAHVPAILRVSSLKYVSFCILPAIYGEPQVSANESRVTEIQTSGLTQPTNKVNKQPIIPVHVQTV